MLIVSLIYSPKGDHEPVFWSKMMKATQYQGNRSLQNVEADDVTVLQGTDSDAVAIEIYCQPVDSIEKIYINITIS